MKYRSISLNETTTINLVKLLTKKFAAKSVTFFDSSKMYKNIDQLNDKLIPFENVGLVRHVLYERPFQWTLDVPDEPKLYDFYKLVALIDDTLARAYRAYHMRLIEKEQIKELETRVNSIVNDAKKALESDDGA